MQNIGLSILPPTIDLGSNFMTLALSLGSNSMIEQSGIIGFGVIMTLTRNGEREAHRTHDFGGTLNQRQ